MSNQIVVSAQPYFVFASLLNEVFATPPGSAVVAPTAATNSAGALLALSFLALLSAGALGALALLSLRKDRALLPALLQSLLLPALCAFAMVVCALVNVGLSAGSLASWAAFYSRMSSAPPPSSDAIKALYITIGNNFVSIQNAWDALPFLGALLAAACTLHAPGGLSPLRLALHGLGLVMALAAGILDSLYSPFFPFKDINAFVGAPFQEPRYAATKAATFTCGAVKDGNSQSFDLATPLLVGALLTLLGALLQLGVALTPAALCGGDSGDCGCDCGGGGSRAEGRPLLAAGATAPTIAPPTAPLTYMAALLQRLPHLALNFGALLCQLAWPFFAVHQFVQLCNIVKQDISSDQIPAFYLGTAMLQPFIMVALGALTVAGGLLTELWVWAPQQLQVCGKGRAQEF